MTAMRILFLARQPTASYVDHPPLPPTAYHL